MILPTHTISLDRPQASGTPLGVYAGRAVQLAWPSRAEIAQIKAVGGQIEPTLYDNAGATYQTNDVVTITAINGDNVLPQTTKYRVGAVSHLGGFLPHVVVQLTGYVGR